MITELLFYSQTRPSVSPMTVRLLEPGHLEWSKLIEWNGYETRQTPLLYVFVDLKVHNVQKNSYQSDCIDL